MASRSLPLAAGRAAAAPIARPRSGATARPAAMAAWLWAVAGLVLAMIAVGGITRLTDSGLSITRWEPILGAIPPMSAADWERAFDLYRATPEYQLANRGMAMEAFQRIYFWEYLHRLLGRLIGLAFALPLAWFALKRAIPAGFGPRLVALLALGGLQGVVGWWMVASGLVDRVDVAHERLAVHLGLAFLILALLAWTALDLGALARPAPAPAAPRPRRWVAPFFALLAAQFTLGAFVAGLRAGTAFNSWPKMGEHWAPPGWLELAPLWRNFLDNPLAVQFAHRSLAYLVAAAALAIAWRLWRAGAGWRAGALAGAVLGQFALGVAVVLTGVPLALGVAHQSGAALLLLATVAAAHWATRPAPALRSLRLGAR